MGTFKYTKESYENAIKKSINNIYNNTFYIEGYCDMPQGRVYIKGDIGGVSKKQARFYLIYMLRDVYGETVWINPIFYKVQRIANKKLEDRKIIFDLSKYQDNKYREFIPFNDKEANDMKRIKSTVGHLMPTVIKGAISNRESMGVSIDEINNGECIEGFYDIDEFLITGFNNTNKAKTLEFENKQYNISMVVNNMDWNDEYLVSSIGKYTKYELANGTYQSLKVSEILKDNTLQSRLDRILSICLDEYTYSYSSIVKYNNTVYDIDNLSDVIHYTKLDRANSYLLDLNEAHKAFTLISKGTRTRELLNKFKVSKNIEFLKELEKSYQQRIDILNKIYAYTTRTEAFNKTLTALCTFFENCLEEYEDYMDMDGYVYDNKNTYDLNSLNYQLMIAIILKTRTIITQLSCDLLNFYDI